ncbi:MAG TPA: tetratricopeptide repeat protein [Blastocatellia bacterium]|nr:tetratricopeptide repeat protein [Blastocatellia bacterium]
MQNVIKQIIALVIILLPLCHPTAQERNPTSAASAEQSAELQEFNTALAQEDLGVRVVSLQRFLEVWPNSERADAAREALVQSLAGIAEKQLAGQEIDRALVSFHQALSVLPAKISDGFFEGTLIRIPIAVALRGYRTDAVTIARKIESVCTGSAPRLGALGEFYISLEAADDAIRVLQSAASAAPDDARVLRTLGAAYRMSLRLNEAMSSYQRVISLNPDDKRAYYELANLQRGKGNYDEALRLYRRQLELDPSQPTTMKGLALTYLAQGKIESANAELERIRALKGSDEEISRDYFLQTQLAFYYLIQGRIAEARKAAEQALAAEPRYSWGRIAAAEIDLAENRYFEAEKHLLVAKQYSNFPTLDFTLGKLYLAAEDFDDTLTQLSKAFSYSPTDGFRTRLGGVLEVKSDRLSDLLAPEQQAAIFLFEPPTTYTQFRLIETLMRLDEVLRRTKAAVGVQADKANEEGAAKTGEDLRAEASDAEVEKAAKDFIEADSQRGPFRALYVAQKLAVTGKALSVAIKLADQALSEAEAATEPDSSLRDYPNYDRSGRLQIFRGRAADAKGWAMLKSGQTAESVAALRTAVDSYGQLPEGRRARWHLAAAKESAGNLQEALELYISAYERPDDKGGSGVNRAVIESLYRKIYGSLDGLDESLSKNTLVTHKTKTETPADKAVGTSVESGTNNKSDEPGGLSSIREQQSAEKADEKRDADKGVNTASQSNSASDLSREQRKFKISLPKLSAEKSSLIARKDKAERVAPAPIVLPVNRASGGVPIIPQNLTAELLMIPVPDNDADDAAEQAPPPVVSAIGSVRPRQVTVGRAVSGVRPRRVLITETAQPGDDVPVNTRKRRVTASATTQPGKQ